MYSPFLRHAAFMLILGSLCLLPSKQAFAGLDSCLKAALNTANPSDLKKAAAFATSHPSCLANLAPPTLVPYIALSGSLDTANQSGALNQVGLGFSDYSQCADKVNPGNAAVKQLAPVLQPVCGALNMNCGIFEGEAANEVNKQLASEVPLLSLLPCACAAANSDLGVEKIAELVKETKKCGAAIAQVGEALGDAAEGVYDVGGDALGYGEDAASYALKLGEDIAKSVGDVTCAISTLWGGCKSTPPSSETTAAAICKSHQSIWWSASLTNKPDNVFVQCNDGMYCWATTGQSLRCEQRRTAGQRNNDIAQMKQWCPNREAEIDAGYKLQCHDALCKLVVTNIASQYGESCLKELAKTENELRPTDFPGAEMKNWQGYPEDKFLIKLNQTIKESMQRDPNTPPVELLRTYGCKTLLGRAENIVCVSSTGFNVCKKLVDAGKINECYMNGIKYPTLTISPAVLGALGKGNATKIPAVTTVPRTATATATAPATPATLTTISNASLLRATPASSATATPAIVVSDTFLANAAQKGCRPFLGRRDELKCENQAGFDECVQAVNRNMLKQCHNAVNGESFPNLLRLQKYP